MPGAWKRFPRHRLQREPLVNGPGMQHGTCATHVPWCMSGSLIRGGGENVPGIPGAGTTRNFTYLEGGPCQKRMKTEQGKTALLTPLWTDRKYIWIVRFASSDISPVCVLLLDYIHIDIILVNITINKSHIIVTNRNVYTYVHVCVCALWTNVTQRHLQE